MSNSGALGGVVEADDPDAGVTQPRQRRRQPGDEGDRHVLDGAGRRLGDGRRDVHGAVAGQEHAVHAGAVAAAHDRAEVAGVGDAVDGDEERRPARAGGGSGRRARPPAAGRRRR